MPESSSAAVLATILTTFLPLLLLFVFNVVCGIVGVNMAKKRKLQTTPAFFAGLFGSIVALCVIALFPVKEDNV